MADQRPHTVRRRRHLYGYVLNDPINITDRAGLQANQTALPAEWNDYWYRQGLYCSYGFCSPDLKGEAAEAFAYNQWLNRRRSSDPKIYIYDKGTAPNGSLVPNYEYNPEDEIDPSTDPDSGSNPAKKPEEAAKKDDAGTACDDKPGKPPCMDCVEMVKKNGRITGPCQLWPPCS